MRAVNLLPRDAGRTSARDGRRRPLVAAAGGIVAVTALSVFVVMSAGGAADERRAELALTESAIAAIPAAELPSAASGLIAQERADRVAALSAALSSRVAVDRVLRELSFVLPADAWLTGLIANAPTESQAASTQAGGPAQASSSAPGVTIQGATFSHESVARVLARLSVLPTLENVRLTASARIQPQQGAVQQAKSSPGARDGKKKQRPVVTFTIAADLRSGGAS
jgi:Tfp pilus assembly protein PilN